MKKVILFFFFIILFCVSLQASLKKVGIFYTDHKVPILVNFEDSMLVSSYGVAPGNYVLRLIIDGQQVDSKPLMVR